MRATPARVGAVCLGLAALLALALGLALWLGTVGLTWGQLWAWLWGGEVSRPTAMILSELRLPRALLAALVGAALSLAGAVFQALLRNPLADPFILGVSGGAAAGAVTALLLGLTSLLQLPLMAFGGALGTIALVMGIARRRGRMDPATVVLTGVMVNAFFTATIMFVISTTTDQKLHAILFWLYGDLGAAGLAQAGVLAPAVGVGLALVLWYARHLNLLSAGEQTAAALGVAVERVKTLLIIAVSLLVGFAVSLSGLIGFVGLMVPHLVRMTLGQDHRLLLPASALFGAAFLVLADTAARTIISPTTLPVGVVTAALGAPFFVLLLARRGSQWW